VALSNQAPPDRSFAGLGPYRETVLPDLFNFFTNADRGLLAITAPAGIQSIGLVQPWAPACAGVTY